MLSTRQQTSPLLTPVEPQSRPFSLLDLLRRGYATNRWLMLVGLLMVLTLLATAAGLLIDHRVITGSPAWVKPAKFAISFNIYAFTFLWLLTFLQHWKRLTALLALLTSVGVMGEMGLIVLQAARGVSSHFNRTTPFDSAVYSIMGTFAVMLYVAALGAAILLLFERRADPALRWSLRLGILIAMGGMYVGIMMTQPTTAQLAAKLAGHPLLISGAHSVGVPDGGPGLPFLGWSTLGGDLRIAHFFGMHALQVLPFVGWFLSAQRFPCLRTAHRVAFVWIVSLGYLGLSGSLLWQALRGQPLLAPDALTWLIWGGILALTLIALTLLGLHIRLFPNPTHE